MPCCDAKRATAGPGCRVRYLPHNQNPAKAGMTRKGSHCNTVPSMTIGTPGGKPQLLLRRAPEMPDDRQQQHPVDLTQTLAVPSAPRHDSTTDTQAELPG